MLAIARVMMTEENAGFREVGSGIEGSRLMFIAGSYLKGFPFTGCRPLLAAKQS